MMATLHILHLEHLLCTSSGINNYTWRIQLVSQVTSRLCELLSNVVCSEFSASGLNNNSAASPNLLTQSSTVIGHFLNGSGSGSDFPHSFTQLMFL